MNDSPSRDMPSWVDRARLAWREVFGARADASGAAGLAEHPAYDPFEAEPERHDEQDGAPGAHSTAAGSPGAFIDVTAATLKDMRQENAHSLDRDLDDEFFWVDARPDAVAGMAKVFLKARCPTPYWRAMVSSNSYALWGAVAMARLLAELESAPCSREHLERSALAPLREQTKLLARRRSRDGQTEVDLQRAEGLALVGAPLGDVHKHAALRALFAAVACDRAIEWPDLPARLGPADSVPATLPGLEIDLRTLGAKRVEVDRGEAEQFWLSQTGGEARVLMVPDWASWMLAPGSPAPILKVPSPLD